MNKWNIKFRELFGIDIRSLALFRIGLGIILLGDLFIRLQDLNAHYTDYGVLPRDVLIHKIMDMWSLSIHLINGTWEIQLVLFLMAVVFAIAFLIGFKTRLATILSWVFLISLQSRNPMVLQGGDLVLRVLLFWGMFLPLGACWSIDRMISHKAPPEKQIFSVATLGLLLQVCFIYWFTALLKTDDIWRRDGTAVWYALSIEQYSTAFGRYLLHFPTLLKILTFATLYLELFGPFFAFSPFWTAPLRFFTAVTFIIFHLVGLNFAMELGHFSYVCAVAWMVFFPSWFWERVLKKQDMPGVPWKPGWISNGLASFFLIYIFLWNVRTLDISVPLFTSRLDAVGLLTSVEQMWDMFSPYPLKEDGWFVIPGKLRDGTEVDLFKNGVPVNWKKPPLLSATYQNDRWRSYMMNLLTDDKRQVHVLFFAKYLCNQWNKNHPYEKQLMSFDIFFMLKVNSFEDPHSVHQKLFLWHHECFK